LILCAPRVARIALVMALLAAPSVEAKPIKAPKPKLVAGTIAGFGCGDNCYLTIKIADDKEIDVLCRAKECAPWVDAQEIPQAMIGRSVKATLGKGKQIDAAGDVMGAMDAVTKLQFVD